MPIENAYFIVHNVRQKHDVKDIKKMLDGIHGVTSVAVNATHNLVCVDYNSAHTSYDDIEHQLNQMGYEVAADASYVNTR